MLIPLNPIVKEGLRGGELDAKLRCIVLLQKRTGSRQVSKRSLSKKEELELSGGAGGSWKSLYVCRVEGDNPFIIT